MLLGRGRFSVRRGVAVPWSVSQLRPCWKLPRTQAQIDHPNPKTRSILHKNSIHAFYFMFQIFRWAVVTIRIGTHAAPIRQASQQRRQKSREATFRARETRNERWYG